jgi:hypothetical protein
MTNTGIQDRITAALSMLATDYDITAEATPAVGEPIQYWVSSPDTLAADLKDALDDTLGELNDETSTIEFAVVAWPSTGAVCVTFC